jgi:hypothetical protein
MDSFKVVTSKTVCEGIVVNAGLSSPAPCKMHPNEQLPHQEADGRAGVRA